jgi:SulP family sulfate permease
MFITGASPAVRRALLTHGVSPRRARYRATIERAVADIKAAPGVTESTVPSPPA